jgi:hypothetical protein
MSCAGEVPRFDRASMARLCEALEDCRFIEICPPERIGIERMPEVPVRNLYRVASSRTSSNETALRCDASMAATNSRTERQHCKSFG